MNPTFTTLPHPGIQSLSPYIPGKSIEQVAREQGLTNIIKLASNENPLGCSQQVIQALHTLSPQQIAMYPTSIEHPLRHRLAQQLHVDVESITLSHGSDMLFYLLLVCFALHNNKHILTHDYAFISYAIQAKGLGIPVVSTPTHPDYTVNIEALIAACTEQTALIFLANPNNPTGCMLEPAAIQQILTSIPKTTLLILDEAYYEYAGVSGLDLQKQYPNLVITRTFSKAYGLAGLRLGYAIAHPEITELLYRMQLPFAVNQAAMCAGLAALNDRAFIQQTLTLTDQGRIQLTQGFDQLNLKHIPSAGNFVTVDCRLDGGDIAQQLQKQGIIVRPLQPYGLSSFIRVTIGTQDQNKHFLNTLSRILIK